MPRCHLWQRGPADTLAAMNSSDDPPHDGAAKTAAQPDSAPDLAEAVTRVEHELGRLLSRIRVGLRDAAATVHPELQPLGYQVLTSIVSGRATTAGAIIERLHTDKSAVSRHVRQLEQWGLVESVRDPDDRRARVLVATELARTRVGLARSRYEERIAQRLRHWTAEDLDRFAELISQLTD